MSAARLLLAAALVPLFAAPASAAPRWLEPERPFGDEPAGLASAAMAPDGTVIVARIAGDGELEVRERPPGGAFGAPVELGPLDRPPTDLEVLTATDGSAAVVATGGDLRFASLRTASGRWTRPDEAFPTLGLTEPGPLALAPGAALWSVARGQAGDGGFAAYRLAGDGPATFTPLPRADDARHAFSALSVTPDGTVRVVFTELTGPVADGARCALRSQLRAVDVTATGELGPAQTLDAVEIAGAAPLCFSEGGASLAAPLLDGDTVVWTRNTLPGLGAKTLARHREPGRPWDADAPPEDLGAGVRAERLFGGPGDPALVLRFEFGRLLTTRGAGGTWTAPRPLLRDQPFEAARTGAGTIAFAVVEPTGLVGRIFDPQSGLGDPTPLGDGALLAVGGDAQGDAVALTGGDELRTIGYDGAGPRVTTLDVPARPVAGSSDLYSAAGVDVWSGPAREATWDFGDGAVEDGLTRPHAYAAGGRRAVMVRLRDGVGNETSAGATVDVGVPAPNPPLPVPAPPRDVKAPRVTHVFVTPRTPHGAPARLLQLTLDEGGTARVVLTKQARGVRRGKRCVTRTKRRGKPCTRVLGRQTVSKVLAGGAQRIPLPRLSKGTWRLRLVVTDAAGNASKPRTLTIRAPGSSGPRRGRR
jgi:hypothetical protein